MTVTSRALFALLAVFQIGCTEGLPTFERAVDRSFTVATGSSVVVGISGGSVVTTTGPAGIVRITLKETVRALSDKDADEALAAYDVTVGQRGDEITAAVRRKSPGTDWTRWSNGVRFSAVVEAPADVKLTLQTSGGSIKVRGERTAAMRAGTSGGSITVDGGEGEMALSTSGGSITVGQALRKLEAGTSGGAITVDYIGPTASEVSLGTSGGSIRAGLDPSASVELSADTSGGSVRVDGFDGLSARRDRSDGRSHFSGIVNGGNGRVRAHTSGGSITIRATVGTVGNRVS